MSKTCGKCRYFQKINWNDRPGVSVFGRNGLCKKYDYNVVSDGSYASVCPGYKKKKYKRKGGDNHGIAGIRKNFKPTT